jgi:hypothetical protein
MKRKLFDEDGEHEDVELRPNEEFARKYVEKKKRDELVQLEAKYEGADAQEDAFLQRG